jgi:hypothetical protein
VTNSPHNPQRNDLPVANTVLAEHVAAIRQLGKQTVKNIVEIGRRLSECKKIVGHGNWSDWLDREFAWSERSAQRFMQVFELAKSKSDKLAELNLPLSAIYLLAAAPETVRQARDEVIARAEAGETIPVAEVKRTIDVAKGVKTSSTKPATHVCWQCGQRGKVGEVKEHRYAQYDDADIWLHDACVSAFDQAEQGREQQREAAAERIHALMGGEPEPTEADLEAWAAGDISINEAAKRGIAEAKQILARRAANEPGSTPTTQNAHDDFGPVSNGEVERLRARVNELQAENRRLERENIGLKSEIEELKARLTTPPPIVASQWKPTGDGRDVPDLLPNLRRAAP